MYVPLGLASAFFCLYLLTWQGALYDDGIFFIVRLLDGKLVYSHILPLPLTALLREMLSPFLELSAESALRLLASLSASATLFIGFFIALRILERMSLAVAATCFLGVLPGFWFFATATEIHTLLTASSMLLLLAMVQTATHHEKGFKARPWLFFAGSALTPASHISGIAALIPAGYAALLSKKNRVLILVMILSGFTLFVAVYLLLFLSDKELSRYSGIFGGSHLRLLSKPEWIPRAFRMSCCQFFMFSVPASTLAPLGWMILRKRSPKLAYMLLCWLLAWPLISFPVLKKLHGGYYLSTFIVQAILAMLAFQCKGRTIVSAFITVVIALLPGLAFLVGDFWGIGVFVLCASMLCFMVPGPTAWKPYQILLLPIGGFLFTTLAYVSHFSEDPERDFIQEVRSLAKPDTFIILFEVNNAKHIQWNRYYNGDPTRIDGFLNLALLEVYPEKRAAKALQRYKKQIMEQLESGGSVLIADERELIVEGTKTHAFLEDLKPEIESYALQERDGRLIGLRFPKENRRD